MSAGTGTATLVFVCTDSTLYRDREQGTSVLCSALAQGERLNRIPWLVRRRRWFIGNVRAGSPVHFSLDASELLGIEQTFFDHFLKMVELVLWRKDGSLDGFLPPTLDHEKGAI